MATTKKKLPAPATPSVPTSSAKAGRVAKASEPRANPKGPAAQEANDADVIVRKDGRRLRRKGVYFDADTAVRVAVHCARINVDLSDYVNDLVEKDLKKQGA